MSVCAWNALVIVYLPWLAHWQTLVWFVSFVPVDDVFLQCWYCPLVTKQMHDQSQQFMQCFHFPSWVSKLYYCTVRSMKMRDLFCPVNQVQYETIIDCYCTTDPLQTTSGESLAHWLLLLNVWGICFEILTLLTKGHVLGCKAWIDEGTADS